MAIFKRASSQALVLGALVLAGCAAEGGDSIFTTGSLNGLTKADPACVTLVSGIEALRKEGIHDKIEKAAARRYRLTRPDLKKTAQLTKTNTEFQRRCSTVPPPAAAAAPDATAKAAPKRTAKAAKAGKAAGKAR